MSSSFVFKWSILQVYPNAHFASSDIFGKNKKPEDKNFLSSGFHCQIAEMILIQDLPFSFVSLVLGLQALQSPVSGLFSSRSSGIFSPHMEQTLKNPGLIVRNVFLSRSFSSNFLDVWKMLMFTSCDVKVSA
jgi:hypothetical protein